MFDRADSWAFVARVVGLCEAGTGWSGGETESKSHPPALPGRPKHGACKDAG
jgi:hypothetical protein